MWRAWWRAYHCVYTNTAINDSYSDIIIAPRKHVPVQVFQEERHTTGMEPVLRAGAFHRHYERTVVGKPEWTWTNQPSCHHANPPEQGASHGSECFRNTNFRPSVLTTNGISNCIMAQTPVCTCMGTCKRTCFRCALQRLWVYSFPNQLEFGFRTACFITSRLIKFYC